MAVVKVELDISLLTVSNPILTGRGAKKPHQWIIEQIKDNVCVMCANTTTIDRMNQREKNARTHTNYRSTFKLIQRDMFWPVNSCKINCRERNAKSFILARITFIYSWQNVISINIHDMKWRISSQSPFKSCIWMCGPMSMCSNGVCVLVYLHAHKPSVVQCLMILLELVIICDEIWMKRSKFSCQTLARTCSIWPKPNYKGWLELIAH